MICYKRTNIYKNAQDFSDRSIKRIYYYSPGGAVVSGLGTSGAICSNLPRVSGNTNKQPPRTTKSEACELSAKKAKTSSYTDILKPSKTICCATH